MIVLLAALLLLGVGQADAQKRKAVRKAAKTVAAAVPVTIDDPVVVDGHIAFLGVPLGQAKATIDAALGEKGFKLTKLEVGEEVRGTAYGAQWTLWVADDGKNLTITEVSDHKKAQAKRRMTALVAGLQAKCGGTVQSYDAHNADGGEGKVITCPAGTIRVYYRDADEVFFSDTSFLVCIEFADKQ